jgi:ABC-type sugar transport system permease subunit
MADKQIAENRIQRKPSKIVAAIAAALLLVCIVLSCVFGGMLPKSYRLATADGSKFASFCTTDTDEWFYATNSALIVRMNGDNEELEKFDLRAQAEEKALVSDCKEITTIQREDGFQYIYVYTASKHMFVLKNENGALSLQGWLHLGGNVVSLCSSYEDGNTLYILCQVNRDYEIRSYDISNVNGDISGALLNAGYIYKDVPVSDGITLTLVKNMGLYSFEVIGDYIYIVHKGGVIRLDKEFSMYGYQHQLSQVLAEYKAAEEAKRDQYFETILREEKDEAYNDIYEDLFKAEYKALEEEKYDARFEELKAAKLAETGAEKLTAKEERDIKKTVESELNAEATENLKSKEADILAQVEAEFYEEKEGVSVLKETWNKKINKAVDTAIDNVARGMVCEHFGLNSFKEEKGEIVLNKEKSEEFRKLGCGYYAADGYTISGCAYDPEKQQYFMVTSEKNVCSYDLAQIEKLGMPDGEDTINLKKINSIKLASAPKGTNGSAFFYDEGTKKGYILYETTNQITCVNFETMHVEFTADAATDIRGLQQSGDGSKIYYVYMNAYEQGGAGQLLLRTATISNQAQEGLLQALQTIFIVLSVLVAIVLLLACLCVWKKGFSEIFVDVMRKIRRHWGIYLILAGSLVLLGMFCYYPAIGSISMSFFHYIQGEQKYWNSFQNYIDIFRDSDALMHFSNMFIYLAFDLVFAIAPPLVFAFCLTIMRNKGYSATMRTLLFIPGVIPGVATTLIWRTGIYGEFGLLNSFFKLLQGNTASFEPLPFLTSTSWAKWSLIMMGFPFVGSYLIFYGAMMNIPDSYYEAAELDGITVMKRFLFIDIPLIFAQMKYVFVMTFISSVQNFGRIYMVTDGGMGTAAPIYVLYERIKGQNFGLASAYATILFVFLFAATAINMRKKRQEQEV